MTAAREKHIPVMLQEVLEALAPQKGGVYVDATFGNGGYTQAILNAADCKVIALDRDPHVEVRAEEFLARYGNRFRFIPGCFSLISELVSEKVDGVVFDIGVSSMQLDESERGFSFAKEGPLDMRMSQKGLTAADIVNNFDETDLANLIYQYGEEKKSRAIAKKIVAARALKPLKTTTELAEIIYKVIRRQPHQIDPATRTFQALRIVVNDELAELETALYGALQILKDQARLVVVDFHSLEDRIVKNFFNQQSGKTAGVSRYAPPLLAQAQPAVFSEISRALKPTEAECAANPRARSAKLRYGIKSDGGKHD